LRQSDRGQCESEKHALSYDSESRSCSELMLRQKLILVARH